MPDSNTSSESSFGPQKISFPTFLLKIVAGGIGGSAGSLILLVVFVVSSSVLNPIIDAAEMGDYISPVFIFLLMVMIFLSSTVGNVLSTLLMSLTENEKYTRKASTIYQIFILGLITFVLMVPVYFIVNSIDSALVVYAVALHIIITAQASALIMEVVSNYKYSLVGIYGVTFSILMSAGIIFGMASFIPSPTILLFAALPVVWGSIAFMHSLVSIIYGWIANVYDKDFLSTQTLYGTDYGKQVEGDEEVEENLKAKDEAGADFLRGK